MVVGKLRHRVDEAEIAQLVGAQAVEILRFQDDSGFWFNHCWTKTLHLEEANVFALNRGTNKLVYSVRGIEEYLKIYTVSETRLSPGFLFCSISKDVLVQTSLPDSSVAQAGLDTYVSQLHGKLSGSHFTLHRFCSGAAISMGLVDVSFHEVMGHVGWRSSRTALHYIKIKQDLNPAGPAARLADLES